jgi:hypothetical protein
MKIVVLDGYTLNPGDISWDSLSSLGELTVYERTGREDVAERIKDVEIVFTNKTPITKDTLAACRNIRFIGVLATGYNIVDTVAAKERNIPVWLSRLLSENGIFKTSFSKYGAEYEKMLLKEREMKGERKPCLNHYSIQPQLAQQYL